MGLSPVTRFKTVEKYWCDENPWLRDNHISVWDSQII